MESRNRSIWATPGREGRVELRSCRYWLGCMHAFHSSLTAKMKAGRGGEPVGIRAAVRQVLNQGSEESGRGWRETLRRLDRAYPDLSRWLGGRLDIEVPAIAVSVGVHGVLLLVLATAGYAVHTETSRELRSTMVRDAGHQRADGQRLPGPRPDERAAGPDPGGGLVLAQPGDRHHDLEPAGAAAIEHETSDGRAAIELASLDVRRATEMAVPTAVDARPERLDQGQRRRARRRG